MILKRGKTEKRLLPITFAVLKGNNYISFVTSHEKEEILYHTDVFNQQSSNFISILSYGSSLGASQMHLYSFMVA